MKMPPIVLFFAQGIKRVRNKRSGRHVNSAGIELTNWTIRLALVACAGCWALGLWFPKDGRRHKRLARGLWTLGCLLLWLHVACAFGFYHHWSHAEALASTAHRTRETIGLDWGGGIFFNYMLMLVWTADVLWWWTRPTSYAMRPRALALAVHGFLAFMILNAAVVFETGATRWVTLAVLAALVIGALARRAG